MLVERLAPTPVQPVAEEQPRRRYSKNPISDPRVTQVVSRPSRASGRAAPRRPRGSGAGPVGFRPSARAHSRDEADASSFRGPRPNRDGGAPRGRSGERNDFGGDRRGPRQEGGFGGGQRGRTEGGEGFRGRSGAPASRSAIVLRASRSAIVLAANPSATVPVASRSETVLRASSVAVGGRAVVGKPGGGFKAGGFKPAGSRPGGGKPGGPKGGGRPPRAGR